MRLIHLRILRHCRISFRCCRSLQFPVRSPTTWALIGRFGMIIPVMALAGSLGRKKLVATGAGTFPVSGTLFVILLIGTILLVGALTFLPALTLTPILEHFLMINGRLF